MPFALNATESFFGTEKDFASAHIALDELQPLWGGVRVLVAGNGRVTIQKVERGLREKRYVFSIPDDRARAIIREAIRLDVCAIRIEPRPGIPDETRPEIRLRNANGERFAVSKWARQENRRFDGMARMVLDLVAEIEGKPLAYEGPFDWREPPDGA